MRVHAGWYIERHLTLIILREVLGLIVEKSFKVLILKLLIVRRLTRG